MIVAPKSLSENVVAMFTRKLFAVRPSLAREMPNAAKIEKPSTDKDAALPAHPGAAAYIDGNERTFMEKYGDYIWGAIRSTNHDHRGSHQFTAHARWLGREPRLSSQGCNPNWPGRNDCVASGRRFQRRDPVRKDCHLNFSGGRSSFRYVANPANSSHNDRKRDPMRSLTAARN